jgi:succinyl-diaminopimelate desuccinylase
MLDSKNAVDCMALCEQLIRLESITPQDQGCQSLIAKVLEPFGFSCRHYPCKDTSNLLVTRSNKGEHDDGPHFIFLGHTDVVPAVADRWTYPAFQLTHVPPYLYGRGIADMKGAIAAMIAACAEFVQHMPDHKGRLSFLITSDEEGSGVNGIPYLIKTLLQEDPLFFDDAMVLVGEPSSQKKTGDMIKIGRRGSLHAHLAFHGQSGHIAYPKKNINPIHESMGVVDRISKLIFDDGDDFFDPTSLQFYEVQSTSEANNLTPDSLVARFNLRFSPLLGESALKKQVESCLAQSRIPWTINWQSPCTQPYFVAGKGILRQHAIEAIREMTQQSPCLSTEGGTSDGRHLAKIAAEVIELGLPSSTIHQDNEHIKAQDLEVLYQLYGQILARVFS